MFTERLFMLIVSMFEEVIELADTHEAAREVLHEVIKFHDCQTAYLVELDPLFKATAATLGLSDTMVDEIRCHIASQRKSLDSLRAKAQNKVAYLMPGFPHPPIAVEQAVEQMQKMINQMTTMQEQFMQMFGRLPK